MTDPQRDPKTASCPRCHRSLEWCECPQRDPIAAAVEGVCGKYLLGYPGTYGEWDAPCMDCEHPRWRQWLRDAREKLAATERERTLFENLFKNAQDENERLEQATTRLREALEEVHELAAGEEEVSRVPLAEDHVIVQIANAAHAARAPQTATTETSDT